MATARVGAAVADVTDQRALWLVTRPRTLRMNVGRGAESAKLATLQPGSIVAQLQELPCEDGKDRRLHVEVRCAR